MITGLLIIGAAFALAQPANTGNDGCIAWLDEKRRQGLVRIEAYCKCEQQGRISYMIKTGSSGKTGSSQTVQQGNKMMHAGESELLAQVNLGGKSYKYSVQLDVYRNGILVAKSNSIIDVN